jgi:uncharacterized protein with HEPN domain
MTKDWRFYALHILDSIEKINLIKQRGDISEDIVLYDATLRNLQILCESTQHLPENLQKLYPEVPWKNIKGFRNILVHDYLGNLDPSTVTKVVDHHLPQLAEVIKLMLKT